MRRPGRPRIRDMAQVLACLKAKRNVLLEGPVGVGKTHLALARDRRAGRESFPRRRRQSLQRAEALGLVRSADRRSRRVSPPTHSFRARWSRRCKQGGVLFINELNRLPEGVQNVLLPAIDERMIVVPRLGEVRRKEGFLVVATQNPKEFVATSHLSEAILDRFEFVVLDYQTRRRRSRRSSRRTRRGKQQRRSLPLRAPCAWRA